MQNIKPLSKGKMAPFMDRQFGLSVYILNGPVDRVLWIVTSKHDRSNTLFMVIVIYFSQSCSTEAYCHNPLCRYPWLARVLFDMLLSFQAYFQRLLLCGFAAMLDMYVIRLNNLEFTITILYVWCFKLLFLHRCICSYFIRHTRWCLFGFLVGFFGVWN